MLLPGAHPHVGPHLGPWPGRDQGILVRPCYAMSDTELACAYALLCNVRYCPSVRCWAHGIALRPCYAMSGSDLADAWARSLRKCA
eukprot:1452526-Rhodomonas_salina.2